MTPDYVPPRWAKQTPVFGAANRWIAARPQRLIAFWTFLFIAGVAGVVWIIAGSLEPGVVLVLLSGLNLAADARYVPRALAACRQPGGAP